MAQQKLVCLVGPTASGKSALAVALAKRYNGEIVSADSRQVYRGLNVGTGKITKREMRGVRHHLLDVVSPKKVFTAHDFAALGCAAIRDIVARGKLPILCGGTGFYTDALLGRVALPGVPPSPALRARLEKKSARQLFSMLKRENPRRARNIDPHNKRRLIRAIEVSGAPEEHLSSDAHRKYDVLWIGLAPSKSELRSRINERLKERLRRGMIAEARRLHASGLSYRRMDELGLEYRFLARFLQEKIPKGALERELRQAIWQYARRQMTYWRRNKGIQWLASPNMTSIKKLIEPWLKSAW